MPVTYADSSYNEVLTWTEKTRIKYVPNPKRGKSYFRYAKYEKAKTVGETLAKGSYPLDLLFDHQHGLLKAIGGPKRAQGPPDIKKVNKKDLCRTDYVLAQMADKWKMWKQTFAAAARTGKTRQELVKDIKSHDGYEENIVMHVKRTEAHDRAKEILKDVRTSGRKIVDQDVLDVLRLWDFYDNKNRVNVMPEGTTSVNSDTLGFMQQTIGGRILVTRATQKYPAVVELMCKWLKDNTPPDFKGVFPFTSINVNKGYNATLHRDGNNFGPSMIKAFGDFKGGQLNYWASDDRKQKLETFKKADATTVDISKNLLMFDGNNGHSVEPFKGERYSLVFFTMRQSRKATDKMKKELIRCGVSFPTAQAATYAKRCVTGKKTFRKWHLSSSITQVRSNRAREPTKRKVPVKKDASSTAKRRKLA